MYEITRNKKAMPIPQVSRLLNQSYWAAGRELDVIEKSIQNSECIGILFEKQLIGFARIVTDYSTMFWLCDVLIDEEHRGKGLGKKMMSYIETLDFYKPLKGILATSDAHGLYEQYGFKKEPEKYMSKNREHGYERGD